MGHELYGVWDTECEAWDKDMGHNHDIWDMGQTTKLPSTPHRDLGGRKQHLHNEPWDIGYYGTWDLSGMGYGITLDMGKGYGAWYTWGMGYGVMWDIGKGYGTWDIWGTGCGTMWDMGKGYGTWDIWDN